MAGIVSSKYISRLKDFPLDSMRLIIPSLNLNAYVPGPIENAAHLAACILGYRTTVPFQIVPNDPPYTDRLIPYIP